ncbi:hypothetical protein DY000_02000291 [Brassica cretica]|uniref:Uncharacterized protein n=1 Tax=Brassica cretica TaxID=69181 RepID=A0ABQ7CJW2_BRACR|nr:hypothetical protein DY000_02000291 [Brassica cretica]
MKSSTFQSLRLSGCYVLLSVVGVTSLCAFLHFRIGSKTFTWRWSKSDYLLIDLGFSTEMYEISGAASQEPQDVDRGSLLANNREVVANNEIQWVFEQFQQGQNTFRDYTHEEDKLDYSYTKKQSTTYEVGHW